MYLYFNNFKYISKFNKLFKILKVFFKNLIKQYVFRYKRDKFDKY